MPFLIYFLCLFSCVLAEENFLLVDGNSEEAILEFGCQLEEQMSPCSTFKIPLSLMGFDAGILIDEQSPIWEFKNGYDDFLETWKGPLSPQMWMQNSCVWYSKLISCHLGIKKIQDYLSSFGYGNQDLSTGIVLPGKLNPFWLPNSTLKISVKEQVNFINKMLKQELSISDYALIKTKSILFKEVLTNDWKLFGKTGWSGSIDQFDDRILEHAWFVGWIEKNNQYFPFAYLIKEKKIQLEQRIPRVIQFLIESGITKN